jgi:hypothetical protein
MIRRVGALAALLALALAACAQPSAEPAGRAGAPAASSAAPGAGPPSADLTSAEGSQTLSGTVTAGVEPHCLVLKAGTDSHLLVFDDESLRSAAKAGTEVTVVGKAQPGMMTTCQQGTPFLVTSVLPN